MNTGRRRGSSILAGLLLVLIGVLFLIDIYQPEMRLGHVIAVYWPVLLIVWGLAKILDYVVAQNRHEAKPAIVSGGEAALIVVLVIVLGGFVIRDWVRDRYPHFNFDMPRVGPSYTRNEALPPQTIPADARLAIDIPRGDISVQGKSGNQLLVNAQKTIWGMRQSSERAAQQAGVEVYISGGLYRIAPAIGFGGRARDNYDLSVQAPASANVAASTTHGDIRIAGVAGSTQAHSGYGDIAVQNAGADVAVNLTRGDARISGAAGSVRVTGRGGDVNISDVKGNASVDGPFYGTIRATNVAQGIHCALPWTQMSVGQLSGKLETDLGDLSISGASGPLKISTHNSDVSVENVSGPIDISDAHSDVNVSFSAPPQGDINIKNDAGDVTVSLPEQSSFEVAATSRGGDADSDFSGGQLGVSSINGNGQIIGRVGSSGGPRITITTSYGTIHLRKTSSNQ